MLLGSTAARLPAAASTRCRPAEAPFCRMPTACSGAAGAAHGWGYGPASQAAARRMLGCRTPHHIPLSQTNWTARSGATLSRQMARFPTNCCASPALTPGLSGMPHECSSRYGRLCPLFHASSRAFGPKIACLNCKLPPSSCVKPLQVKQLRGSRADSRAATFKARAHLVARDHSNQPCILLCALRAYSRSPRSGTSKVLRMVPNRRAAAAALALCLALALQSPASAFIRIQNMRFGGSRLRGVTG